MNVVSWKPVLSSMVVDVVIIDVTLVHRTCSIQGGSTVLMTRYGRVYAIAVISLGHWLAMLLIE